MFQIHRAGDGIRGRFPAVVIAVVASFLFAGECWATGLEKLPGSLRTNGDKTLAAVGGLEQELQAVTVSILDEDKVVALGTIVSREGVIVTKASELGWQTSIRLEDDVRLVPERVVVDELNDLAVLVVDRKFPQAAPLETVEGVRRGRFVVAAATRRQKAKLGIISADSRVISREGGALGVMLDRQGFDANGVRVSEVVEESAAERSGIKPGDIIRSVDGVQVSLNEELIKAIGAHFPGENVLLKVERSAESLEINVVLGFKSTYFGLLERNQMLSGVTSTRLNGFQEVIQHDVPVDVRAMGGPVADLHGRVLGINIARADRVATFALPAALVLQSVDAALASEDR